MQSLEALMANNSVVRQIESAQQTLDKVRQQRLNFDNTVTNNSFKTTRDLQNFSRMYIGHNLSIYYQERNLAALQDDIVALRSATQNTATLLTVLGRYREGDYQPLVTHIRERASDYRLQADQTGDMDKSMKLEQTAEQYDTMAEKILTLPPPTGTIFP